MFANPWLLALLAVLPVLWWLMRTTPPLPRRLSFPAVRILLQLTSDRKAAAHTPPWLLALRLSMATLAILGAAQPLLRPLPKAANQPLLLVVDNGWAAAPQWQMRQERMLQLIAETAKAQQRVAILATAPPEDGGAIALVGPLAANDAKAVVQALAPLPWPTDRTAAVAALSGLSAPWQVEWLADGLNDDGTNSRGATALGERLDALGRVDLILARPSVKRIVGVSDAGQQLDVRLAQTATSAETGIRETVVVRAVDEAGRILARRAVELAPAATDQHVLLDLPTALRNQTTRIDLDGVASVGATFLLDDRWRRRIVGLADPGQFGGSPLLDDLYYSERALTPLADIRRAPLDDLIAQSPSLIVLPDEGAIDDTAIDGLKAWIARGGVLLRLAGPKLAANPDDLLPVALRDSRMLGGTMSADAPMALAPMPANRPFAGLAIPSDVTVKAQLLAEPGPDLNDRVWARLTDGTPLITGQSVGKGWLVLIHTTIGPAWSNLGLSGLYPQLLSRLIGLSQGMAPESAGQPAPPDLLLDGYARLGRPSSAALPLPPEPAAPPMAASPVGVGTPPLASTLAVAIPVGPRHPPGFYGHAAGARRALNLNVGVPTPLAPPPRAQISYLSEAVRERDLQGWCFGLAAALLLLDMLVLRHLRGDVPAKLWPSNPLRRWRSRGSAALGIAFATVLLVGTAGPLKAAESAPASPDAILETRLGYVMTNDRAVDEVSRSGLQGLTRLVNRRTTAQLAEPKAVDLERDTLVFYPLLYWPVTSSQNPPSEAARLRINQFIRHGGIIVFDSRDHGQNGPKPLNRLTAGLDIPPLTALTVDHVLSRSFYLLEQFPGRYADMPVYVEDGADPANDGVSPVIAGSADWAAAWAEDRDGHALYPTEPDDARQRDLAFRFGVNLVMYALTGTYKADQVHFQAILDRMKR